MTILKNITLSIAVAAAFASVSSQAQQAEPSPKPAAAPKPVYQSKKLDRAEIDALLAKPDQVVIVDVRRPDELIAVGGFPVYLSIQAKDLEKNAAFIPRDRTIVTVSNHAGRALPAADLLKNKGFKVAGAIGVQDYESQGGTLLKIAPPPPKVAGAPAAPTQH